VHRRADDARVALLEVALEDAGRVSHALVNYESVWPLNTYRDRDPSKLSDFLRERLVEAEKMTQADYRKLLATRAAARAAHAMLLGECDLLLTLSAPGAAPMGIEATGDTVFNIPASYLGAPALSLPLLTVQGLPLGVQAIGFPDRDAELFESAGWIDQVLR
jgi:Asp-tRNA(Asn)/Glu-tRNA(Gln) amidotransferase A subunit family amidase